MHLICPGSKTLNACSVIQYCSLYYLIPSRDYRYCSIYLLEVPRSREEIDDNAQTRVALVEYTSYLPRNLRRVLETTERFSFINIATNRIIHLKRVLRL